MPGWVAREFYNFEFDAGKRSAGARQLSWGTATYKERHLYWFGYLDATETLGMSISEPLPGFTPPMHKDTKWKDKYCLVPEKRICDAGGAFEDIVLENAPLQVQGLRFKIGGRFPAPLSLQ